MSGTCPEPDVLGTSKPAEEDGAVLLEEEVDGQATCSKSQDGHAQSRSCRCLAMMLLAGVLVGVPVLYRYFAVAPSAKRSDGTGTDGLGTLEPAGSAGSGQAPMSSSSTLATTTTPASSTQLATLPSSTTLQMGNRSSHPIDVKDFLPPHYDHGVFHEKNPLKTDGSVYDYDAKRLFSALNCSNPSLVKLVPLMAKLVAGRSVKIIVFGGSETLGNFPGACGLRCGSGDSFCFKTCGWPERLQQWLRKSSGNLSSNVENRAVAGTTSSTFISGLRMLLADDDSQADLIVLDTLVNDAAFGGWSKPFLQSTYDMIRAAFEVFVRTLHHFLPHVPILVQISKCKRCIMYANAHYEVANHYNLPVVNYPDAGAGKAKRGEPAAKFLWNPTGSEHPGASTHQLIADAMAFVLINAWLKRKSGKFAAAAKRPFPSSALSPKEELERYHVCLEPLSYYNAGFNGTRPDVVHGDWALYEDRPGKPGWISTTANSEITFNVTFGTQPQLAITYLRSYEDMGRATLALNGQTNVAEIDCLWDTRYSQSYTAWFRRKIDDWTERWSHSAANHPVMHMVKPNSSYKLTVKALDNSKVKIIKVVSC